VKVGIRLASPGTTAKDLKTEATGNPNHELSRKTTMRAAFRSAGVAAMALALGTAGLSGCATWNNMSRTGQGAVIGAAGGAAVGGAVGSRSGKTAAGAIVGATVGGTAGALIGRQMDRQARELAQNIPGAKVERIGEGIQVTFDSGILFDFDSDRLRPEARSNLQTLASSLHQYPNTDLLVVGHTDNVGRVDYNQGLSERRARSAASYLSSIGVGRTRLNATGRGMHEPVAANDSDWGRQQNRRVEIAIYASEAYREQMRRQHGE
jgi:outer membrane protein OmpA-like peptidoglycan-associated protein